jgi:quinohemoprotein ethanol dehydrogenase
MSSGIGWNTATGYDFSKKLRKEVNAPKLSERLTAWDPINQRAVWSVPHKAMWNGGVLTTSTGLVFEGTADGKFIAFDGEDGKVLWQKDLGSGIIASPVTYQVGDTQYIAIVVGWGGAMGKDAKFTEHINPGTVYTFALNKSAPMPVFANAVQKKLIDIPFNATQQQVQHGSLLFTQYCVTCHGSIGEGGGNIPDPAYSSKAIHEIFNHILLQGLFVKKGMPNFSGKLSESDVTDIHNYILATAKGLTAKQTTNKINQKSK